METSMETTRLDKWLEEWQKDRDPLLQDLEGFKAFVSEKTWWDDEVQVVGDQVLQPYESEWAKTIYKVLNRIAPTKTRTVWGVGGEPTGEKERSCTEPVLVGEWVAPEKAKLVEGIRKVSSLKDPFTPGKPAYKVVTGMLRIDMVAFNMAAPIGLMDDCQIGQEWDPGQIVPKVLAGIETRIDKVETSDLLAYLEFVKPLGKDEKKVAVRFETGLKGIDAGLFLRTLGDIGDRYTTSGKQIERQIYVEWEAACEEINGKIGIGTMYDAQRLLNLKPLLKKCRTVDIGFGDNVPLAMRFKDANSDYEILYILAPIIQDGEPVYMDRYFAQTEYKLPEKMGICDECRDMVLEKELKQPGEVEGYRVCPRCYREIQETEAEAEKAEAET